MPDTACTWILSILIGAVGDAAGGNIAVVPDTPFVQEVHEPHAIDGPAEAKDVRAVAVDRSGRVWAATAAGVHVLNRGTGRWSAAMDQSDAGPAYDVVVDDGGTVWAGAWNGIYRSTSERMTKVKGIDRPIAVLAVVRDGLIGVGPDGLWRKASDGWRREALRCSRSVRAMLPDPKGGLWLATQGGLVHRTTGDVKCYRGEGVLVSADVRGVAYGPAGRLWIGGIGGITVREGDRCVAQLTPEDGLPNAEVRCIARGPDGRMWIGTALGVARTDGKTWSLRHTRRWLVSDDVRDVAFDADGTAWIATDKGVSAIKPVKMTLADKADRLLRVCLARHVRPPGLVGICRLTERGNVSTWKPHDDDNDGQYTAMYLAMESFRLAATRRADARDNARRAFEALHLLQTVTGTPGFVARSVVPIDQTPGADPNRKVSQRELADQRVRDPRYKRVETRWHRSADGKWWWKGDTSSDEITGHLFGYLYYHDLAAEGDERKRVAALVARIVDHIIAGGYCLRDLDGEPTRWAVWSPEKLNGDPDWAPERGINSVEILSFLKAAHHMTGDERYQEHYLRLLRDHGYAANVRRAKTTDPGWRTHIDDELLALAYPALLKYEKDPALRRLYRESLDQWYAAVSEDDSPFFEFIYASLAGRSPRLRQGVAFLRDAPLDLIYWHIDNSRREDVRLVRRPEAECLQTDRLLPPSERGVVRWDRNTRQAVQGSDGRSEGTGVGWLLPYWMGRYYGFIGAAGPSARGAQ